MTAEERQTLIKAIVAEAPALKPEQAVMLRSALLSASPNEGAPKLDAQGLAHPRNEVPQGDVRTLPTPTDIEAAARRGRAHKSRAVAS